MRISTSQQLFQARRAVQTWLLTLLVGATPLIAAETVPPVVAAEPAVTTAKAEQRVISVDLQLSPELQQYQHQNWTLYLFAKPLDSRVPVASKKLTLDQLPQRLELTEQDFLLPHLTLAGSDQVVVAVKVSRNNSPHETLAGDLVGKSPVVDFAEGNRLSISLLIDEEVE